MHSFFRAQDNIYGTELDDYVRSIQVNCLCRLFLFSAFATSALSLSLRAWHAMVSLAPEGTHDVLVLRKGTGAVALGGAVARAQLCCQK